MDSQMQEPLLSIVAIGRNEARNIEKLSTSISNLTSKLRPYTQTIFVDSASTDDTYKLATESFDEVYLLEESPWLCAASGRALGTLKARGKWILYLDGDMELCQDFISTLEQLIAKDEDVSGYIGSYIYVFPDGKSILNSFRCMSNGEMASAIGGASILRRAEVLKAGNWDPSIFAGEEMELYSRLRAGQRSVRFVNVPFVLHYTDKYDPLQYLLRLLHPALGLGKQWYGMGQILAARIRNRNILSYIRLEPYPFACWSGIAIGIVSGLTGNWPLGVSVAASIFALIFVTRGWKSLVIHTAKILPALVGWIKYNPEYSPRVLTTFRRPASNSLIPGISFHKPPRL